MKKIITHSGIFHADDVFSVAFIFLYEPFDYKIIRTREKSIIDFALSEPDTWVLDIGNVSNPLLRNFDHHQNSKMDSTILQLVDSLDLNEFINKVDIKFFKDALQKRVKFISAFDINENSLHQKLYKFNDYIGINVPNISTIIHGFNREPENEIKQNIQFLEAVNFAKSILINWIKEIEDEFESIKIFNDKLIIETVTSKAAVMNKYCTNWRELLKSTTIRYVIMPDIQGYSALSVNAEKYPIKVDENHEGLIFLHDAKFVAKFATKDSAIKAIKKL